LSDSGTGRQLDRTPQKNPSLREYLFDEGNFSPTGAVFALVQAADFCCVSPRSAVRDCETGLQGVPARCAYEAWLADCSNGRWLYHREPTPSYGRRLKTWGRPPWRQPL